jgi:hypothetical protein
VAARAKEKNEKSKAQHQTRELRRNWLAKTVRIERKTFRLLFGERWRGRGGRNWEIVVVVRCLHATIIHPTFSGVDIELCFDCGAWWSSSHVQQRQLIVDRKREAFSDCPSSFRQLTRLQSWNLLFCYLHYLYLHQLPSKILPRISFTSQEAANFFPSAFRNLQKEKEKRRFKKRTFSEW